MQAHAIPEILNLFCVSAHGISGWWICPSGLLIPMLSIGFHSSLWKVIWRSKASSSRTGRSAGLWLRKASNLPITMTEEYVHALPLTLLYVLLSGRLVPKHHQEIPLQKSLFPLPSQVGRFGGFFFFALSILSPREKAQFLCPCLSSTLVWTACHKDIATRINQQHSPQIPSSTPHLNNSTTYMPSSTPPTNRTASIPLPFYSNITPFLTPSLSLSSLLPCLFALPSFVLSSDCFCFFFFLSFSKLFYFIRTRSPREWFLQLTFSQFVWPMMINMRTCLRLLFPLLTVFTVVTLKTQSSFMSGFVPSRVCIYFTWGIIPAPPPLPADLAFPSLLRCHAFSPSPAQLLFPLVLLNFLFLPFPFCCFSSWAFGFSVFAGEWATLSGVVQLYLISSLEESVRCDFSCCPDWSLLAGVTKTRLGIS